MSDTRQHVHELVDRLPPAQLEAVAGLLESMVGSAPEPISPEEERAVAEAKQWLGEHGGKGIPHKEVLADFGLTEEDFRRMGKQRAQRRGRARWPKRSSGRRRRAPMCGASTERRR